MSRGILGFIAFGCNHLQSCGRSCYLIREIKPEMYFSPNKRKRLRIRGVLGVYTLPRRKDSLLKNDSSIDLDLVSLYSPCFIHTYE